MLYVTINFINKAFPPFPTKNDLNFKTFTKLNILFNKTFPPLRASLSSANFCSCLFKLLRADARLNAMKESAEKIIAKRAKEEEIALQDLDNRQEIDF